MPSPAILFAGLLFGVIGLAAFIYGRKNVLWGPMVFGGALMVLPYLISQAWLLYTLGAALCAALYYWRD